MRNVQSSSGKERKTVQENKMCELESVCENFEVMKHGDFLEEISSLILYCKLMCNTNSIHAQKL